MGGCEALDGRFYRGKGRLVDVCRGGAWCDGHRRSPFCRAGGEEVRYWRGELIAVLKTEVLEIFGVMLLLLSLSVRKRLLLLELCRWFSELTKKKRMVTERGKIGRAHV